MKKYCKSQQENKAVKWSEGFSNSKTGLRSKTNKAGKNDDIEFEDGTVMMVDETAEVKSITGNVQFFAIEGVSLKINGIKRI